MKKPEQMGELIPFPSRIVAAAESKKPDSHLLIVRAELKQGLIHAVQNSDQNVSVREGFQKLAKKYPCTNYICVEEAEETVDLQEIFERALDNIKKEMYDPQLYHQRYEMFFIHPSTQTLDFRNKLLTFIQRQDVIHRVNTELRYGGIRFSQQIIDDQEYYGFMLENFNNSW